LFTGAKISHLGLLPQGQAERERRGLRMVQQVTLEQFGACTNIGECEAACPKQIPLEVIARMNRDHLKAAWKTRGQASRSEGE
jgi:succinate dehydrogenase / fumarate reductase iron-sulfur subunit